MHQRQLGPFKVSAIGLGCMNVSMGYGPTTEAESLRLFEASLDAGYRFLDTAAMYGWGYSETLVGRALRERRNDYVLASKCGFLRDADGKVSINGQPESIRATCESSLRNLQTDVIDLYYLHRVDPNVPVEESVGALARLVDEGKIRSIGLSEVSTETLRRAHAVYPVEALQSEYALWSRTPERQILAACRELGVAFVPFSPLGRSFLTGVTPEPGDRPDNDLRDTIGHPRFNGDNWLHNKQLLPAYFAIADEVGCTPAQLALAWLLALEDGSLIPIPGTRSVAHMQENAGAGDIALGADVVRRLDALINEDTVAGPRYTEDRLAEADSERD